MPEFDAVIGHLLRSSQQIREDLTRAIGHLSTAELDARPGSGPSAGFHARHLADSTNRLCAYLEGRHLTPAELDELAHEQDPGESAAQLLDRVGAALDRYETLIRALAPAGFATLRYVGRKRLPVTAIGLAIHIAEHGQRHAGQAMSVARIAKTA